MKLRIRFYRGRHRPGRVQQLWHGNIVKSPILSTAQVVNVLRPTPNPKPLADLLFSPLEDLFPTMVLPVLVLPAPHPDPALQEVA